MFDKIDADTVPVAFVAFGFIIASFITFFWNKKWGIILLVAGSALLGYFMASLDPFLNLWDEQQHALVAKNMANNPFKPTLYNTPLLHYDHKLWIANHIWIHKQPLFLWQMAIFIKIMGAKVIAVRLPSVILHAALTYLVYRIGKSMRNETVGFIAAIFITVANFPLELIAGRYATDHNDMSFLFYITWSFFSWVEYQKTKDKKWLIWLGISAGCAVLVKWLMGLLVYVVWFLVITFQSKLKVWQIKQYFVMIKPILISLLVFLPWQIYCYFAFPKEFKHEMTYSARHFDEVIEGHSGEWDYHLDIALEALYFKKAYLAADWMPLVMLILVGIGIWQLKNNAYRLFAGITIVFVYVFFSLAATKMLGFTLIAMPIVFITMCSGIVWIKELWSKYLKIAIVNHILLGALILSPSIALLKMDWISSKHSLEDPASNDNRQGELLELELCHRLNEMYDDEKIVAFNTNITTVGAVQVMFFTDYIAYAQFPTESDLLTVLDAGYKPVIIDRNDVPEYLVNDPRVEIVQAPTKSRYIQ